MPNNRIHTAYSPPFSQRRVAGIKEHIPFYSGELRIVEVINQINFISELLTPKEGKVSYHITRPQALEFRRTAQQPVYFNPLDFYLWGHLKTLVCSAPISNEETLHRGILYACQTIRKRSSTSESV